MSTNTYVALKTTTVTGSPAASVTLDLTGITGYTDLVLVASVQQTVDGEDFALRFNNDGGTGSLYSRTIMYGNGSSAASTRNAGQTYMAFDVYGVPPASGSFTANTLHIMNYANATTYKTVIARNNAAGGTYPGTGATAGLWRNTAPITSIQLFCTNSSNIAVGSTFTVYGIANADVGAYATGGIITQDANYYYHAFGSSSTFTPTRNLTADILVVAGGGGGGAQTGGGGGAGGLVANSSISLANGTSYTCTIGAGGAGSNNSTNGANGVNSNMTGGALSLTAALGGGGGASFNGAQNGSSGGSGGGGAYTGSGGAGTSSQGYAGGNAGSLGSGTNFTGGGGGGAGGIGGNGTDATITGGIGGNGTSAYNSWLQTTGLGVLNSSDNLRYLAGGGGGSAGTSGNIGIGGKGGGGNSNIRGVGYASSAIPNTGSGGGGDGSASAVYAGNGGSGLIIVRYSK